MSQRQSLLQIYGAIDRAVRNHPERRRAAARLLPVYRKPDVQWFDDYERWMEARVPAYQRAKEDPQDMLHDALAELENTQPKGRMRARRMYAVAAAAQVFPDLRDPDREPQPPVTSRAQEALRPEVSGQTIENSRQLLARLRDLPAGDLDAQWQDKLDSGLIEKPEMVGPRPCVGRLVMIGKDAVPTLMTEFEADLAFEDACEFLRPEKWAECSRLWCDMDYVGKNNNFDGKGYDVDVFRERVGLDCDPDASTWTIEAELDFRFRKEDGLCITDYRLRDGRPQPDVLVDEGSLVVRDVGTRDDPKVIVTTTKRVEFSGPVHGEALAMVMCLLGYASVVEDLLDCASGEDAPNPSRRLPTPGEREQPGSRSGYGSAIQEVADRSATAVKDLVDDHTDAVRSASDRIDRGEYGADALVNDMAALWARMMRQGAEVMEAGLSGARTAARGRPRGRSRS